ncbi:serine hydrolase domain-containing protein [Amycolatopsis pigmentata]|uniref:Serine hydrolase domain-containing protein n=1 Tax=Amycolatopsis pigmentata TaxID=450801 RepID=A0ABW5FX16_9PSEU
MRHLRTRPIAAIFAAAVIVGLGTTTATAAPVGSADNTGLTQALRAELEQYLATRGTTEHVSAVSLRVDYPAGKPSIDLTAGTAEYGGTTPVPRHSEWQIGSNTKAFTSVILLQLEAEGKLSIQDTLGKWLPQYPAWRDITVQRLLDMTSGIPDYTSQPAFVTAVATDRDTVFTTDQLVSYVTDLPVGPAAYAYSNTNYLLAQMIIERAAHDTYAHELTRRLIVPHGLWDTCFAPYTCPPSTAARMPTGYFAIAGVPSMYGTPMPSLNLTFAQGAGGIVASLADLTAWERALYTGRLLPPHQRHELESLISTTTSQPIETTSPTDPTGYGLGIGQATTAQTGTVWTYEGQTLGFRALHIYDPASGVIVVVAVNSAVDSPRDELPALVVQALQTVKAATPARPRR